MSGTSADGITAAAVRFIENDSPAPDLQLLATITREYAKGQRERLLRAGLEQPANAITRLDFELGEWLADAARAVMTAARLRGSDVRAIASHGHTVWHAGAHGTWQIGQAAVIAERTGLNVVSDFRVRDAAAGGQGAPLVAIADMLLFAAPDHARALQNIGGIANVSVVPARGGADPVLAFDTGPGCGVIDATVRRLVPSLAYDVEGAMALRGTVIPGPVDAALADPYFAAKPPKSTGREKFSAAYANAFVERCLAADRAARPEDIVATAVSLTARSIGVAYQRFVPAAVARCAALRRRREESRARARRARCPRAAHRAPLQRRILRRRREGSGGLRVPRMAASGGAPGECAERHGGGGAESVGEVHAAIEL